MGTGNPIRSTGPFSMSVATQLIAKYEMQYEREEKIVRTLGLAHGYNLWVLVVNVDSDEIHVGPYTMFCAGKTQVYCTPKKTSRGITLAAWEASRSAAVARKKMRGLGVSTSVR